MFKFLNEFNDASSIPSFDNLEISQSELIQDFKISESNSSLDFRSVVSASEKINVLSSETASNLSNSNYFESGLFNGSGIDFGISILLMFVHVLLIVTFLVLLIWYPLKTWWKAKNIRSAFDPSSELSHLPLPPGDFGLPFVGETFRWLAEGIDFNANRRKKHGGIFTTNIAIAGSMVRVSGHEHVKKILLGEHTKVTTIWPKNFRQILGVNGLSNSTGAIHSLKRKIACKAFAPSALNKYIPILQKIIDDNVSSLSQCDRPLVYNKMLRLTFDMAASALIGLDPQTSKGSKLIEAFQVMITNMFSIPLNLPGFAFRKALKARDVILDMLQEHVSLKKETILKSLMEGDEVNEDEEKSAFDIIIRELILENMRVSTENHNNNKEKKDFSSEEYVKNLQTIDDLALKEIAIELIFAGYFTTASSLTSCLLELSRHPGVLRNLENELVDNGLMVEGDNLDCDNGDLEIDVKKIQRLTYMEQVLKETLRLRPPVLGAYRQTKKTFELGGYRIPKGWSIIYNIRDTHEMEFEELSEFNPEKFASGSETMEKFRYIPFGGGPRTCIGREYARLIIKMSLINIIRKYRQWDLVNEGLPKMNAIPTLHPKDGLPCIFHPRKNVGVISRS